MKISNLKKDEILNLIKVSYSINDLLKKIKVNSRGSGAYKTFRNHCKKLNIDLKIVKFKGNINYPNGRGVRQTLSEILVENSTYQNISRLKVRLVREKILKYECKKCGNKGKWCEEKLSLHLDHINGVNNDHRIKNLRFLCPNCHSQTKTYGGSNQKRIKETYQ